VIYVYYQANERRNGPGSAITIVIGGAEESLHARPGVMELVLKKRHGFIRIAIESGAMLVPILAFGENGNTGLRLINLSDLFQQAVRSPNSWVSKFQEGIKKLTGFTTPLVWARGVFNYDFGLMPWRHEINTVGMYEICFFDYSRPTT
jgi:2-acylglycerol O-acyltransferase 2